MERTETPALWRKPPVTEIPVPVAAAPAPYSATAKRGRTVAQGPAGADQIADASRLETRSERRDCEAGKNGEVVGAGTPGRGCQPAGRNGRMLHDQSNEHTAIAASLPGQHELDRESTFGSSPTDQASMPMAGQADGKAVGCRGHAGDRKEFPSRHGSQGYVGAQSDP